MIENMLIQSARAGLYYLPEHRLAALQRAADHTPLTHLSLDCSKFPDRQPLLIHLGKHLHFPEWYGANFDALFDCLTEPGILPREGCVLVLHHLEPLRQASPEDFATLLEVLASAAETLGASGIPCWIITDSRGRGIADFPKQ